MSNNNIITTASYWMFWIIPVPCVLSVYQALQHSFISKPREKQRKSEGKKASKHLSKPNHHCYYSNHWKIKNSSRVTAPHLSFWTNPNRLDLIGHGILMKRTKRWEQRRKKKAICIRWGTLFICHWFYGNSTRALLYLQSDDSSVIWP